MIPVSLIIFVISICLTGFAQDEIVNPQARNGILRRGYQINDSIRVP